MPSNNARTGGAIIVRVTNDAEQVRKFVEAGFCPVECSVGGESITDELAMDHHGTESHREGVAIRAYRDHFGARSEDPRFVIVGTPDADATFAIASLAGILPHPEADEGGLPALDLTDLATTVALVDTDPIGRDIGCLPFGDVLLTWNAVMAGAPRTSLFAEMGVGLWRQLVSGHPAHRPLLAAGLGTEADRREAAKAENLRYVGSAGAVKVGFITDATTWGFDVWYGRRLHGAEGEGEGGGPEDFDGWRLPVVLARVKGKANVTIGCPNQQVAEELFGVGGLKNVFPLLDAVAPGWGGREAIGGSPRGEKLTEAQLHRCVHIVHNACSTNDRLQQLDQRVAAANYRRLPA